MISIRYIYVRLTADAIQA